MRAVHICDICGREIVAGEKYVDFNDRAVCVRCVEDDLTPYELISLCGYGYSVAEELPPDDEDDFLEDW